MSVQKASIRQLAVIANPASGKPQPILAQLNQVLGETEIEWKVYVTSESGDVSETVNEALDWGASILAAYGGDGTVSLVAAALAGSSVPMAVLPGGTANVMALELGIPAQVPEAARLIIGQHRIRSVDMGRFGDKAFLLRLGIGFEAEMVRGADPELKERIGSLAYFISAVRAMQEPQQADYKITIDGESFEENAITCLIANSMNLGLPDLGLSPKVQIDDGLLDLILIRQVDLAFVSDLAESMRGKGSADGSLAHWQGQEIKVEASPSRRIEADGEEAGWTPIQVKVDPGAVQVIVPRADGNGSIQE